MQQGWIVVKTHARREEWARENIERQGGEPLLLRVAERVSKLDNFLKIARSQFLFPGYVFVKMVNGRWRFLLGTYGVSGVIMQGSQPGLLPDREIEKLQARVDENGFVRLPPKPEGRFKLGTAVRITEGHYADQIGLYEGCGPQRCERVLLNYLGRKSKVLIAGDSLVEV